MNRRKNTKLSSLKNEMIDTIKALIGEQDYKVKKNSKPIRQKIKLSKKIDLKILSFRLVLNFQISIILSDIHDVNIILAQIKAGNNSRSLAKKIKYNSYSKKISK